MTATRKGLCGERLAAAAVATIAAVSAGSVLAGQPAASQPATTSKGHIEDCLLRAAQHHRVNSDVLRAILRVESNLDPRAVGRNADGSVDLGIGQINSRHFSTLARHGIQPGHLLDGCVGAYVAAWHLSTLIAAHGNSWTTIALYHSATPYLNRRYQVLIGNELVAAGVLSGVRRAVPPAPGVAARRPVGSAASWRPAMVWDEQEPGPAAP